VADFIDTVAGPVPRLATALTNRDHWGTVAVRIGLRRNNYTVTPGLYCLGNADKRSPVLVTGNYKLTVDALRKELGETACWLLVVDTRGINVWCAAGKGSFSAHEVAYQIQQARLAEIVDHRHVILPQLAASGVNHRDIKRLCGFRASFGPIRANDIAEFLQTGTVNDQCRAVSFTTKERLELIPVEIFIALKPLLAIAIVMYLLTGITPDGYSLTQVISRGNRLLSAIGVGLLSGAAVTPLLLPWIPVRSFWAKGAIIGTVSGLVFTGMFGSIADYVLIEKVALLCWIICCSSYLAMNFTGSTPFTSHAGVVKEMRLGLKVQLVTLLTGITLWLITPFIH
jgi:hypothetical protein